jgi:hypothetical protein
VVEGKIKRSLDGEKLVTYGGKAVATVEIILFN